MSTRIKSGENPIARSLDAETVSAQTDTKLETSSVASGRKSINMDVFDELDLKTFLTASEESNEVSATQKSSDPDAQPDSKQEDVSMGPE